MTVANTKAKSVYNANGVTREWQIGFDFDENVSKLNIILEDIEGKQSVIEDNYIIEDGAVIYPTVESELDPVAEGNKIIIFRTTPLTQEKDLSDNIVESGLDKLTLQVQEISEQVGRAIKVPISEDGLSQYKNPITEIREETKKSLDEIQAATDVVSSYTAESATNAATSKEEADRAVEASNVSVMASSDAEAAAVMAENLSNEAKDAVSAYVNGLGAMRNSVIDLGLFESNQRRASSCIIDFDYEPLDVFIRFSDSERKMWIKGSHSFAGFEKIGDKKYKIFYSVSSEDFASQSAIKGPFYVQYVIKYSVFSGHPVTYRGRVDTVDQLPETAQDGDLWYVGPIEQSNKEEYIWQEGKWELLGSTDFSSVYSKEEIDNKVSVIETSIDANADAIQKTRDDFATEDTNLQNQITTNKNDIKDLGDQVSVIEAKIPADATEQNQLVTKTQMDDAIANAGSSVDLTGYYNRDNLLGADEIEIVPEPVDGGIDEHTLACWHFDGNQQDEVSGLDFYTSDGTYLTGKFGQSITKNNANYVYSTEGLLSDKITSSSNYTVDFWLYYTQSTNVEGGVNIGGNGYYGVKLVINQKTGKVSIKIQNTEKSSAIYSFAVMTWYFLVLQKKGNIVSVFINGVKILEYDASDNIGSFTASGVQLYNLFLVTVDEVRISDVARYDGDFTPPTKAYSMAVPTGNYLVRNKTKLVRKSDIGVANGVAGLDENGKVPVEQIPTGSGSGSGFDFEGTKAEFDAAVAAGTITEDSVSLITDDVSGDNVATKAELQAVDISKADTSLSNLSTAGKDLASGLGMPSNRYINLELGASGSTYTAPANGWLFLDKVATSGNYIQFLVRSNNNLVCYKYEYASADLPIQLLMPIGKGHICKVNYTASGKTNSYRFIYAEGAE